MRCVFVKLPSYSAIWVDGKKKISVLMSSIFTSPLFTSGPKYQCVAVSVSQLSLTTSQSSWRSARRVAPPLSDNWLRSEEHTSELQSQSNLVCRLLLEKKKYVLMTLTKAI